MGLLLFLMAEDFYFIHKSVNYINVSVDVMVNRTVTKRQLAKELRLPMWRNSRPNLFGDGPLCVNFPKCKESSTDRDKQWVMSDSKYLVLYYSTPMCLAM